jgi:hypothetical protein
MKVSKFNIIIYVEIEALRDGRVCWLEREREKNMQVKKKYYKILYHFCNKKTSQI